MIAKTRNKYDRPADAIIVSDIHLRDDTPICRTDDFVAARTRKVAWLRDLQKKHDSCPIICGGDVFDRWEVSSALEGWALRELPDGIITVPGQHDMPQHSLALYEKSSLHVLEAAGKITVLRGDDSGKGDWQAFDKFVVKGFPFGEEFMGIDGDTELRRVAIIHAYVAETVPPFIERGWTPDQLLAALPGYDLVVAGDNHAPLDYGWKDRRGCQRLVVVPGAMMRMSADEADAHPRAYLWFAEENEVLLEFFPIEVDAVSREHLERREERDARLGAFVERLDGAEVDASLSFERNVEEQMNAVGTSEVVRQIVREAVDSCADQAGGR